ncbi:MAG: hypothetical protein ACKO0M_08415, partial [Cyanobium sp.]
MSSSGVQPSQPQAQAAPGNAMPPPATLQRHAIAPAAVVRGEGAWADALPAIAALGRRPLLLGRSAAT